MSHDEGINEKARMNYYKSYGVPKELYESESFAAQYKRAVVLDTAKNVIDLDHSEVRVSPVIHIKTGTNVANIIRAGSRLLIMAGDVPISADGEYRPNLMDLNNSHVFHNDSESEIYTKAIQMSGKIYAMEKKQFLFPPDTSEEENVKIIYFIICAVTLMVRNKYPNNFKKTVLTIFKKHLNVFPVPSYPTTLKVTKVPAHMILLPVGIKIIPLYINDLKTVKTFGELINFETEMNVVMRDLKYSCILYNVPYMYAKTIAKLTNINIFSDRATVQKYKDSKKYVTLVKDLYDAGQIEGEEEIIKTYKKKVKIPISYAEKHMVLSKYAAINVFENVGFTLTDNIIKDSDADVPSILSSLELMNCFTFQLLYTLYCFNTRAHIIHCDLHFNNITSRSMVDLTSRSKYVLGGKEYSIHAPKHFFIIDYGRAQYSPEIIRQKNLSKDHFEFYKNKLLKYCSKILPEFFAENKKELTLAADSSIDAFYHILQAFDFFYVLTNIKTILLKYLTPPVHELVTNMTNTLHNWIRDNINNLIQRKPVDEKNPNLFLIEQFFKENKSNENVWCYCNADNPIKLHTAGIDKLLVKPKTTKKPNPIFNEIEDYANTYYKD